MKTLLVFYTVMYDQQEYPVKYIDHETCQVKAFHGSFRDPGEASQEFQASAFLAGIRCRYLNERQFQGKVRALAQLRRDRRKENTK